MLTFFFISPLFRVPPTVPPVKQKTRKRLVHRSYDVFDRTPGGS